MPENFFTTEYLFSASAPTNIKRFYIMLGIFVFLIIAGFLINMSRKIHRPLKARFFNFLLTIGIVGLIISAFRYESIPYIGSRFVLILLVFCAAIWYLVISYYAIFKMPKEVKIEMAEQRYLRYLPKKKNNKK